MLKNAHFKKEDGNPFVHQDLMTLSFDKKDETKPMSVKEVKALLGSKIRKNGK